MTMPTPKWSSPDVEALLSEARKLPEHDRLRLADELRASVSHNVSAEWDEEVLQRAEAFARGELRTVDAKDVFSRVEAKYARLCSIVLSLPNSPKLSLMRLRTPPKLIPGLPQSSTPGESPTAPTSAGESLPDFGGRRGPSVR